MGFDRDAVWWSTYGAAAAAAAAAARAARGGGRGGRGASRRRRPPLPLRRGPLAARPPGAPAATAAPAACQTHKPAPPLPPPGSIAWGCRFDRGAVIKFRAGGAAGAGRKGGQGVRACRVKFTGCGRAGRGARRWAGLGGSRSGLCRAKEGRAEGKDRRRGAAHAGLQRGGGRGFGGEAAGGRARRLPRHAAPRRAACVGAGREEKRRAPRRRPRPRARRGGSQPPPLALDLRAPLGAARLIQRGARPSRLLLRRGALLGRLIALGVFLRPVPQRRAHVIQVARRLPAQHLLGHVGARPHRGRVAGAAVGDLERGPGGGGRGWGVGGD
jgi:hypothetical protein